MKESVISQQIFLLFHEQHFFKIFDLIWVQLNYQQINNHSNNHSDILWNSPTRSHEFWLLCKKQFVDIIKHFLQSTKAAYMHVRATSSINSKQRDWSVGVCFICLRCEVKIYNCLCIAVRRYIFLNSVLKTLTVICATDIKSPSANTHKEEIIWNW